MRSMWMLWRVACKVQLTVFNTLIIAGVASLTLRTSSQQQHTYILVEKIQMTQGEHVIVSQAVVVC